MQRWDAWLPRPSSGFQGSSWRWRLGNPTVADQAQEPEKPALKNSGSKRNGRVAEPLPPPAGLQPGPCQTEAGDAQKLSTEKVPPPPAHTACPAVSPSRGGG